MKKKLTKLEYVEKVARRAKANRNKGLNHQGSSKK